MRKQGLFLASLLTGYLAPVFPSMSDEIVNVEQGWSPADKTAWYTLTQGSRLLPLSWLRALEQPDSDKPFMAPEYMAGFRYLPGPGASDLPPRLCDRRSGRFPAVRHQAALERGAIFDRAMGRVDLFSLPFERTHLQRQAAARRGRAITHRLSVFLDGARQSARSDVARRPKVRALREASSRRRWPGFGQTARRII